MPIRVDRAKLNHSVCTPLDLDVRAKTDRRVQRGGAVVKEVERPDVDGPAGQIDAGRCGRG